MKISGFYRRFRSRLSGEFIILTALFVLVTGLWAFTGIADEVLEGETGAFDRQVTRLIRGEQPLKASREHFVLTRIMRDVTALGGMTVLSLVIIFVSGFLLLRREYFKLLFIDAATGSGMILGSVLKQIIGRSRPEAALQLMVETSRSFPSGHSLMSAIVYLTFAALLASSQPSRRIRIYLMLIAVFLTIAIGISRIYLGVHYPTDVLAGWSLGAAWASFCWLAALFIKSRREQASGGG